MITAEVAAAAAFVSTVLGILVAWQTLKGRYRQQLDDAIRDAAKLDALVMEVQGLKVSIQALQTLIAESQRDRRDLAERLAKVEQKASAAHARLDRIEAKS